MNRWFCLVVFRWGFRLRVLGYCVVVDRDWPRLFLERAGFRKVYRIGRWSLRFPPRRM